MKNENKGGAMSENRIIRGPHNPVIRGNGDVVIQGDFITREELISGIKKEKFSRKNPSILDMGNFPTCLIQRWVGDDKTYTMYQPLNGTRVDIFTVKKSPKYKKKGVK